MTVLYCNLLLSVSVPKKSPSCPVLWKCTYVYVLVLWHWIICMEHWNICESLKYKGFIPKTWNKVSTIKDIFVNFFKFVQNPIHYNIYFHINIIMRVSLCARPSFLFYFHSSVCLYVCPISKRLGKIRSKWLIKLA